MDKIIPKVNIMAGPGHPAMPDMTRPTALKVSRKRDMWIMGSPPDDTPG